MNKLLIMMTLSACLGITACSSSSSPTELPQTPTPVASQPAAGYKTISPEAAKERLAANKAAILLDVRTQEEYTEKHIPGSILIPVDVLDKEAPVKLIDKTAEIIIYCRTGRRSAIAAETLAKLGYTNVSDLGGIVDWPYETTSGNK